MDPYNEISIQPLAVSTREERFLLSRNGRYYEASRPLVDLLQSLQKHEKEEEGISSYVAQEKGKYTYEQIVRVIQRCLLPLLSDKDSGQKKRTFLYEKELLPPAIIDRFSDAFRFLFRWYCMAPVMLGTLLLDVHFLLTTDDLLLFNNQVNAYTVMGLLIFMVASSLFHEIGHASACKYFGIRHGGIGFGLYLNFPVLYTDVTEVWRLGRMQRCVVNLAGVYFQCFAILGLLGLYALVPLDEVRYLILTMNLGFLMTLNPFFKFDGYWLASDLLGVPNLRKHSLEWWQYFYRSLRGLPVEKNPYLLSINRLERTCLFAYSVLVNLFMGYYFGYIIPHFLYSLVCSFPDEVERLLMYLANRVAPPFALIRNIGMQLVFLALIGIVVTNWIKSLRRNHEYKRKHIA